MISRKVFKDLVRGYRLTKHEEEGNPLPVKVVEQKPVVTHPKEETKKDDETFREAETKGFAIPAFKPNSLRVSDMEEDEQKIKELKYPLIPSKPKKDEPIFAYAHIRWDEPTHRYIYSVMEPQIPEKLEGIYKKVKDLLEQKLDVDFSKLRGTEAVEYLAGQMNELIDYFDFRVSKHEKMILKYYIERDFVGLGKIEPFMRDDNIEDISCDGIGIPLFIFHRNPKIGSLITNVKYDNEEELDSFVTRLVQLSGKSISVSEPLVDGSLPDGSRLQATLATDIARKGSNFTIRKFTKIPLTPVHLLDYNTLDIRTMAYLWMLVDYGFSIIVSGGTASGKTSMLNVLSLFIRPDKKIVSIEDTAELQLPHPHWVPSVARTSISEGGGKRGEVDLFDLLKESLRQRPDFIIVGEVRGKETYILFQQMSTGHPSMATIHAENMSKLVDRLTTEPIALPSGLIDSLDVAIFLARMRYRENFVRRVTEVVEIVDYDSEKDEPLTNTVFKWNSIKDSFDSVNDSVMMKRLSEKTGMKDTEVMEELTRRMAVLNWMKENSIKNYENVNKVINLYYNHPRRVMASIMSQM